MRIQEISNKQCSPVFTTRFGDELQNKILLAEKKNLLSQEYSNNIKKIKKDGIDAILDITKKYIIKKTSGTKGIMESKKFLSLKNGGHKVDIDNISKFYENDHSYKKTTFFTSNFAKIFSNDYDLASKIKQAWEELSKIKH